MTSEEFIGNLPGRLQPLARLWLPVVERWGYEAAAKAVSQRRNWYRQLLVQMTAEEQTKEDRRRLAALKTKRLQNAAWIAEQRQLLIEIAFQALSKL